MEARGLADAFYTKLRLTIGAFFATTHQLPLTIIQLPTVERSRTA